MSRNRSPAAGTPGEYRRFMTAGPKAPAAARAFVRQKFGDVAKVDDLVLMVSELVTNAVRHGPQSRVLLRLIDGEDSVRVEVRQLPSMRITLNGASPSSSGFGLKIVEALSDTWGTGDPEWTGVWLEVTRD